MREPGNQNEIEVMTSDVEPNGEDDGAKRIQKREIYGYLKPITVTTNDNLCNSSTNASKNNDTSTGGTKTVTNTETNTVIPNEEGNNKEEAEEKA